MSKSEEIQEVMRQLRVLRDEQNRLLAELSISAAIDDACPGCFDRGNVTTTIKCNVGMIDPKRVALIIKVNGRLEKSVPWVDLNNVLFDHVLKELVGSEVAGQRSVRQHPVVKERLRQIAAEVSARRSVHETEENDPVQKVPMEEECEPRRDP